MKTAILFIVVGVILIIGNLISLFLFKIGYLHGFTISIPMILYGLIYYKRKKYLLKIKQWAKEHPKEALEFIKRS